MFPIEPLVRFEAIKPSYKLVRPFWNVLQTDYLVTVILLEALLSGVMQITQDNFVCLPVIKCDFSAAYQDINATAHDINRLPTLSSQCKKLNTNKTTVIILSKLQDRRQYDFVDSECRQKDWEYFAYYFPFVIFIEVVILIIIGNFWFKYPQTSAILDNFCNLVEEGFNLLEKNPSVMGVIELTESPSQTDWKTEAKNKEGGSLTAAANPPTANMESPENSKFGQQDEEIVNLTAAANPPTANMVSTENSESGQQVEERVYVFGEANPPTANMGNHTTKRRENIQQNEESGITLIVAPPTAGMGSLTSEEARTETKLLQAKVETFREMLGKTERPQVLLRLSQGQVPIQIAVAVVQIAFNVIAYLNMNESPKCEINEVIDESISYFQCSHTIIPYFKRTLQFWFVIILVYVFTCGWVCVQLYKLGNKCVLNLDRGQGGRATFTGDFAFLLYLLNECNEAYMQKFSFLLSKNFRKRG